jgi:hypothetical protein
MLLIARSDPRAEDTAPAEAAPDAELLLFLAEFGDAQEGFVDPTEVDEAMTHARAPVAADRDASAHAAPTKTSDDTEHEDDTKPHR